MLIISERGPATYQYESLAVETIDNILICDPKPSTSAHNIRLHLVLQYAIQLVTMRIRLGTLVKYLLWNHPHTIGLEVQADF